MEGIGVALDSDDLSTVSGGCTEGEGSTFGGVTDAFGVESDGNRES